MCPCSFQTFDVCQRYLQCCQVSCCWSVSPTFWFVINLSWFSEFFLLKFHVYLKWILHNINSLHFYFLNCKVTGDCNQDSRGKSAIDKVFIVISILKLPFPCYLTPNTDMAVSLRKLDIMFKVDCANVSVSAIQ
jgi:hypothetical protein